MNQKHLLLLLLIIILQASSFHTSKAAYILEGLTGEKEDQLTTWRKIKKSIHRQLWVEGKKIEEVSGVPAGIKIHFVPDSLMQAFGLFKLHGDLSKVKHTKKSIEERLKPDNVDKDFAGRIEQKRGKKHRNWVDITQDIFIKWLIGVNFNNRLPLQYQFSLENAFLNEHKSAMESSNWIKILDDFYPPHYHEESSHFIYLSPGKDSYDDFAENLDKDKQFLQSVICFEQECEDRGMVALLRGAKKFPLDKAFSGGLHSFSFSRGYYSGLLKDIDATPSYRSRVYELFYGFPARREIIQPFLFIPPFSWYKNLGLGGEFWHPRTTVAIDTPYLMRTVKISIKEISLYAPIDRLGVLVKLHTFPNHPLGPSVHHYSKVIDYYTSTRRLYDKEAKKFKEPVSDIDIDTMIEIYRTVYPENAYLSGF